MIGTLLAGIAELLTGLVPVASATKRLLAAVKSTAPQPRGMGTAAVYMTGRTDEQRKTQMQDAMEQMTGDARRKLGEQ